MNSSKYSRMNFMAPVKMQELVNQSNQYDVGVFSLPPTNFSYMNALPNKIFEYIQARSALAIGLRLRCVELLSTTNVEWLLGTFMPEPCQISS